MMAAWREAEESRASEEEEEEDGCWEYDSTWEEDDEEEEEDQEPNDGAAERLEEEQGKKEPDAAAAENAEQAGSRENPQPPVCRQPPNVSWARGTQEQRKPSFSFGFGRFKTARGRNWMAARDMQRYRRHYPGLEETDTEAREEEMWNLSFYKNEIRFLPRGIYIDQLLDLWQNDYKTLEENHSYIQWLFPLREQGMNWRAKLLTCREIQAFKKSKEVMDRFVQVYQLMLGFYGIELTNKETGELRRAENWRERFHNLNLYSHNNLRITRILKCLGELGYEHYQVQLVKFFLTETLVHQTLPQVQKSALDYFMFTVRHKQKRRELVHFAWEHFDYKRDFVWGPHRRLLTFKPRSSEFLSSQAFEEVPGAHGKGAGETEGTNQAKPPNQTRIDEHPADRTTDVSSIEPLPGRATEKASISMVDRKELKAESQVPPVTELEGSEKMPEPSPVSAPGEEAKGCSGTEDAPVSSLGLEREGLAGDSESGPGGTDGESLKESKKRKLEMNKPGEERVPPSKSPTDIERISCNLEEVAIDKEGPDCHPAAEEVCKPLAPEGDGAKEGELADAKVKRRKVDEAGAKGGAGERAGEADHAVPPSPGHVTNCMGRGVERTDQVEAPAIDASVAVVEALADCRTVGGSPGNPTEPDPPLTLSVPDQVDEQETTSTADSKGLAPCQRLPANQNEEEEEEGAAGERKSPPQKPEVLELHPKQDGVI